MMLLLVCTSALPSPATPLLSCYDPWVQYTYSLPKELFGNIWISAALALIRHIRTLALKKWDNRIMIFQKNSLITSLPIKSFAYLNCYLSAITAKIFVSYLRHQTYLRKSTLKLKTPTAPSDLSALKTSMSIQFWLS